MNYESVVYEAVGQVTTLYPKDSQFKPSFGHWNLWSLIFLDNSKSQLFMNFYLGIGIQKRHIVRKEKIKELTLTFLGDIYQAWLVRDHPFRWYAKFTEN